MIPSGVQDEAPAGMGFSCILRSPDNLSWHFNDSSSLVKKLVINKCGRGERLPRPPLDPHPLLI